MVTLSAILRLNESRRTFQLFSQVVGSQVQLTWMPDVILRFTRVAQAGRDVEILKSDKVIYYYYNLEESRKILRFFSFWRKLILIICIFNNIVLLFSACFMNMRKKRS